jgi:hypothetical protein
MDVDRRLAAAAGLFVAANLLHTADHLRRGWGRPLLGETPEVLAGGVLISVAALVTLWLAVRRSPRAPLVAAVVGFASAVGIAAAHLAPPWGVLSDSFVVVHPAITSWGAVLVEIAAAALLGAVGLAGLRPARSQLRRPA